MRQTAAQPVSEFQFAFSSEEGERSLLLPHSAARHTGARSRWRRNKQPNRNDFLLAEAESVNNRLVALGIVFFEVVEQTTTLADQHEKTAARAMIFQVRFEVLRQLTNAFAQQSDLDFWTASIGGMRSVLVNEGFLLLSG